MASTAQSAVFVRSAATDSAVICHDCQNTLLVPRSRRDEGGEVASPVRVQGPCEGFQSVPAVLRTYDAVGFQATSYGRAVEIARNMLRRQPVSRQFIIQNGEFIAVPEAESEAATTTTEAERDGKENVECCRSTEMHVEGEEGSKEVYPSIFFGMTANLFGTGCREAVRFLVKFGISDRAISSSCSSTTSTSWCDLYSHEIMMMSDKMRDAAGTSAEKASDDMGGCSPSQSGVAVSNGSSSSKAAPAHTGTQMRSFLSALVTSGGGIEHDIRRACEVYYVDRYASEEAYDQCQASVSRESCEGNTHDKSGSVQQDNDALPHGAATKRAGAHMARFGNIRYTQDNHAQSFQARSQAHEQCALSQEASESVCAARSRSLFDRVMQLLVQRLLAQQAKVRLMYTHRQQCDISDAESSSRHTHGGTNRNNYNKDDPTYHSNAVDTMKTMNEECDGGCTEQPPRHDVPRTEPCPWVFTPSQVWRLAGLWLPQLLYTALAEQCRAHAPNQSQDSGATLVVCDTHEAQHTSLCADALQRAQSTVVYWAAQQSVPIFCPSFADGDIMHYILDARSEETSTTASPSAWCNDDCAAYHDLLQLDLVGDIHALNKMAMVSKNTGMIICGGGVVKHHICNANLMRNGADYAIFINNGMEFDGSDAGARPDEAVSWGKIRIDGRSVKIYSEVTAVLPLLVAQVFVPAARGSASVTAAVT